MKKIIATILSLITVLSLGSMTAFASLENDNEFSAEKCTKRRSKRYISEEKKNIIKETFIKVREQNPNFTDTKIYEIIGGTFNVSVTTARHCSCCDDYKKYYKKYYEKNKEKRREYFKQYYKANKERCNENYRRYYEANKERCKENKKKSARKYYEKRKKQQELLQGEIGEEKNEIDYYQWTDAFID